MAWPSTRPARSPGFGRAANRARRELVRLRLPERRHALVLAIPPDTGRRERLLDERLRAEEGDERIFGARGRLAVAHPNGLEGVHAVGREAREEVAQARVLAHPA